MKNIQKSSLAAHKKSRGKLEVSVKVPLNSKEDLSLYYTPGVAAPCLEIARDSKLSYEYTGRGNSVAVVTDGSAVLGLGNIGGVAGMPVMEGKCALFKKFAGINAVPICLDTQNVSEIIAVVKAIAPSFGGINLEDIAAPRCFEIEERLIEDLDIPVFHDDQHGTAIVCLAGLINALKIVHKGMDVKIVIAGAGAAGTAIAKLFLEYGFKNIILSDRQGLIYEGRRDMDKFKNKIAKLTNKKKIKGGLAEACEDADVLIGVAKSKLFTKDMIRSMRRDSIVFAMANPDPEITPEDAFEAGARIVATGRSDYPNQINNVLVFPGIFRGALDARAKNITNKMKLAAALALAKLVKNPSAEKIIPGVFDRGVSDAVSKAVKKYYGRNQ